MDHKQLESEKPNFKEFFWLSNLLSLFRVLIIPVLWYFLAREDQNSAFTALGILIVAGLSDGLDGYLARKLNQISRLGMILDPLCDKILAGALVVMLIMFREFPVWLAAVIIGRDILILAASAVLLKGRQVVFPSTISGKYAFFFIVVLLACSIIRFELGVTVAAFISVILIGASFFIYARSFAAVRRGETPKPFEDKPVYRNIRVGLTGIVLITLLFKLYLSLE